MTKDNNERPAASPATVPQEPQGEPVPVADWTEDDFTLLDSARVHGFRGDVEIQERVLKAGARLRSTIATLTASLSTVRRDSFSAQASSIANAERAHRAERQLEDIERTLESAGVPTEVDGDVSLTLDDRVEWLADERDEARKFAKRWKWVAKCFRRFYTGWRGQAMDENLRLAAAESRALAAEALNVVLREMPTEPNAVNGLSWSQYRFALEDWARKLRTVLPSTD